MASQHSAVGDSGRRQAPRTTMNQELSFVHISSKPAKSWRANNKVVRAHVMRRYKREQRNIARKEATDDDDSLRTSHGAHSSDAGTSVTNSDKAPASPSEILPLKSGTSDDGKFDGTWASNWLESQLVDKDITSEVVPFSDIRTWLDGGLDPFACLPIPCTPHRLMLLHQNTSIPIRTSVHADPDDLWRRSCSGNPAWLYMTLFYASSRFPGMSGSYPGEDETYLLQSISAVNDTISKSPSPYVSDSTIAAVACLANIDNLNGVSSDAAVHINGLVRMVELRGGLSNLGMQGILRRMVLWSDLLASSRLGRAPRFPFYPADTSSHISVFTPAASPELYSLNLNQSLSVIVTAKTHVFISDLMLSLHQLSTFLNLTRSRWLPKGAAYPDRVYELEYSFLHALFEDQILAETEEQCIIGNILLHAGLLFIYTNLRETPVGGAIRCRLLRRLKSALTGFPGTETFTAEILWVLLLGASTSSGPDQLHFLEELNHLRTSCKIDKWCDAKRLLENVPALETRRLNICMVLWQDLELSNTELGTQT